MQGVPSQEYPSNFVFRRGPNRDVTLLLNVYVDDLTLAGGCQDIQDQFWDALKTRIKIDPPEYITEKGTKILGRIHKIKRTPEVNRLTYDMTAYAKGIVEFFCEVTDVPKEKLRSVTTPCLPEANMCDEELDNEGQLSKFASRILMRCLWLSRLCRPDIAFAVQRLASRVTRWTKWEDRQTYRLVSYLHSTCNHVLKLTVDPSQQPSLHVFMDSNFASCPYTAKSTSGIVYVIKSGIQHYPVMWQSKKQSSTARSTAEAELIAFASALFGESLHLHTMLETLTESNVQIVFEQDNQATITILEAGYSAELRGANRVHTAGLLYVRGPTCKFFNQSYAAYALARSIEPVMHCCTIDWLLINLQQCHWLKLFVCAVSAHMPEINVLCAHSDRGFHHVQIEGGVVETHEKQPSMMVAISFCLLRQKQVRSAASRCDCIYILKTLT